MKLILKITICTLGLMNVLSGCTKEQIRKSYANPEVTIFKNDSRLSANSIHFVKDTVYVIATNININAGQELKIEAGTLLKMNDGVSVIINPGATIEAEGTPSEPIIFTSSALQGTPGLIVFGTSSEHSWAGISIYGNDPSDNASSGTLKYVRIEFAGGSITNNENSLPSLTLTNVSKNTTIENVQISYSVNQNSFQISGGDFNAKNLISYASGVCDFFIADGYHGMLQNLLAYRHPYFAPQGASSGSLSSRTLAGLLISGETTFPVISNITVLGPGNQSGMNQKYLDTTSQGAFGSLNGGISAAIAVTGGHFNLRNSLFMGFPSTGFYLGDHLTAAGLLDSTSLFEYNVVQCEDSARAFYLEANTYLPYTSTDFRGFMLRQRFHNQYIIDQSQLALKDPYNYYQNPDPFPNTGSVLLTGADFNSPAFEDSFFEKNIYRGALGNNDWINGWANFRPLETNYNN